MKKLVCVIAGTVLLALGLGCAGGDPGEIRSSPCDWRDRRAGCEEEKVQCADPRNCY